eukprot:3332043-Pleurochrysis_carterae.AAC.1
MHATPTPRTTRVTRCAAYGNGARLHHQWCLGRTVPSPSCCLRALTPRPHGASQHALQWPQGARRRRARPAATTRST